MSDKLDPTQSAAQSDAPILTSADRLEKRRKLVRLAISGAPLMVSLPTAVSAQTVSSAYRAAQKDKDLTPGLFVTEIDSDSWLRLEATRYIPPSGSSAPTLFKLGTLYYTEPTGLVPSQNVPEPSDIGTYASTIGYVLVLFEANYTTPQILPGVPYPVRSGAGYQGLHASSWSSVNPGGLGSFNGLTWTS